MKIGDAVNFFCKPSKVGNLNLYESPIFIENSVDKFIDQKWNEFNSKIVETGESYS